MEVFRAKIDLTLTGRNSNKTTKKLWKDNLGWKLEKKVVIKGKWGFIQVMMMIIRETPPWRRQQYNHHQCHALASIIYDPVDCN